MNALFRRAGVLSSVTILLVVCFACHALAAMPTTVEEQTNWLGDLYAVGLEANWGHALSQESIAASRAELVAGLRDLLKQPLTGRQFFEVSKWTLEAGAVPSDVPPPELFVSLRVRNTVHTVGLYLSRPPLTDEQREGVLSQAGTIYDSLRQPLVRQFPEVPDVETMVAGQLYKEFAWVASDGRCSLCPSMKRSYTDEEMAELRQSAAELAVRAREDWEESRALWWSTEMDPSEQERMVLRSAQSAIGMAATLFQGKMRAMQYTPPQLLTPEEQAALRAGFRSAVDVFRAEQEKEEGVAQ